VLAKRIAFTTLLTAIFCFPLYLLSHENGAPQRHTGGPFPGEKTCTESDCHGGIANSGTGSVSISINGMPLDQYRYTPGETVPVSVTVTDPTKIRWGFEITARHSNGCQQAGDFMQKDLSVIVQQDTTAPGNCPEATIQFPTHSFPMGTAGGGTFELNWSAPSASVGPIVFAAAGNAANGNNGNDGDLIYTTNGTVQPKQDGGGTPPPAIDSGGAILSTGTPVVQQASATAIITVFGEQFAPEGTLALNPALDGDGKVATQLASTCLEVNNVRAPMFAVAPTQVNAQIPSPELVGPGTASVLVVRHCGSAGELRSSAENLVVTQSTPAFFNFVNNTRATSSERSGYWAELTFGRLAEQKDIQFGYTFVRIERDAVLGAFNESDLRAATNVRNHRLNFGYQAYRNVQMSYTLWLGRLANPTDNASLVPPLARPACTTAPARVRMPSI